MSTGTCAAQIMCSNDASRTMADLVLSVDGGLLQKAREVAVREHTSVNAVVREFLIRYVDIRSRRLEALDTLAAQNHSRRSGDGLRESLHKR